MDKKHTIVAKTIVAVTMLQCACCKLRPDKGMPARDQLLRNSKVNMSTIELPGLEPLISEAVNRKVAADMQLAAKATTLVQAAQAGQAAAAAGRNGKKPRTAARTPSEKTNS